MDVVGGTAWLWASDKLHGSVDVLFIDEAGQFSLANAVAVSAAAAASLVLLGDPQQLDQPTQGTHPPGAERSALAHLLGDAAVRCRSGLGLFMDRTWRLHPEICAYTSEVFYERQAGAAGRQRAAGPCGRAARLDGEGIRFVAVDHEASRNDTDSPEEAEAIADVVCGPARPARRGRTGRVTDRADHSVGHPRRHALQRAAQAHRTGARTAR